LRGTLRSLLPPLGFVVRGSNSEGETMLTIEVLDVVFLINTYDQRGYYTQGRR
jgi:hypothetical protein